jgi:hypothetical protein
MESTETRCDSLTTDARAPPGIPAEGPPAPAFEGRQGKPLPRIWITPAVTAAGAIMATVASVANCNARPARRALCPAVVVTQFARRAMQFTRRASQFARRMFHPVGHVMQFARRAPQFVRRAMQLAGREARLAAVSMQAGRRGPCPGEEVFPGALGSAYRLWSGPHDIDQAWQQE